MSMKISLSNVVGCILFFGAVAGILDLALGVVGVLSSSGTPPPTTEQLAEQQSSDAAENDMPREQYSPDAAEPAGDIATEQTNATPAGTPEQQPSLETSTGADEDHAAEQANTSAALAQQINRRQVS